MNHLLLVPGGLALLVACDAASGPIDVPRARFDLRAATGLDTVSAVGIAVDPSGQRFLFDERAGLYRLAADGSGFLVSSIASLPIPDVPVQPPFTDLVAVGPDRFAVTAIGDGFLLDVASHTMVQYFCYLPDDLPDDSRQRTDALAFDGASDRIYAQPRTYSASDPDQTVLFTQIAGYDRATGVDLEWHEAPPDLRAGGMVMLGGELVVGAGTRLGVFDLAANHLERRDDLARFGVAAIEGLAFDPSADTLLVVDGPSQELVEIDVAQLRL